MTKEIKLNHRAKAIVDDKDFERLNPYKWILVKSANNSYAGRVIMLHNKNNGCYIVRMHREILGLKPNDKTIVDHLDGNGLNNTKNNLRITTSSINCQNQRSKVKKNKTGFIGVTEHIKGKKWRAEIGFNMSRIFLGMFDSAKKAGEAYDNAALFYFGKQAQTNFPHTSYETIMAPSSILLILKPDDISQLGSSIDVVSQRIRRSVFANSNQDHEKPKEFNDI